METEQKQVERGKAKLPVLFWARLMQLGIKKPSLRKLASLAKLPPMTVSNWCLRKNSPTHVQAQQLADALGWTTDNLYEIFATENQWTKCTDFGTLLIKPDDELDRILNTLLVNGSTQIASNKKSKVKSVA